MISQSQQEFWTPRLLSIVRVFLGLLYMQHGLSKYFGFPGPSPQGFQIFSMVGLAGFLEIVGGGLLALGVYTRAIAFVLSGQMAFAYFIWTNRMGRGFFPATNGGQLEAVYAFFFFTIFLVGGGIWSVDKMRERS